MKIFAFYLPQFHPDPMNDFHWGKNFTEWDNVFAAESLYPCHKQPFLPSPQIGKYDLSKKKSIVKQIELAKKNGIDGFAIYYYHFEEGVRALHKPLEIIYNNRDLDIEYFVAWVNADWTKAWVGDNSTVLYKQKYTLELMDRLVSDACKYMLDDRYVRVDNIPIYYIHSPISIEPDFLNQFLNRLMSEVKKIGIEYVKLACPEINVNFKINYKFDYLLGLPPGDISKIDYSKSFIRKFLYKNFLTTTAKKSMFKKLRVLDFREYSNAYVKTVSRKIKKNERYFPVALSGWDNTPRYKYEGFLFENFTPKSFFQHLSSLLSLAQKYNKNFLIIKAWNEWAEGNVLEPSFLDQDSILKQVNYVKKSLKITR